jgi:hypothetical protein
MGSLFACPASELKGQETSGTATVRVKPDSVRIFFGVAKAVEEARANAAALAEGAKARVKDTIDINGQPRYYLAAVS